MRLDRQLSCTVPSSGKHLVRISAAWRRAVSASGEQLVTSALLIGSLVTVSLFIVPDLGTTNFRSTWQAFGIRTRANSDLRGPDALEIVTGGSAEAGQGAVYTAVHLRGSVWNAF